MKRMILIVLRNLYRVPYAWLTLWRYARHTDQYTDEQRFSIIWKIVRWVVDGARVHLEAFGQENIPRDGGFVFFPNHQGLFDPFAIADACPVPFTAVYKQELKNIPFLKQILACVKAVSLDRDNIRQGLAVIKQVAMEVHEGRNFLIFAEGTRSRNGNQVLDFKSGSFKSAMMARCPIVPVALIDSYKVFDANSIAPLSVQVHFLPALRYEQYKEMDTAQGANWVKEAIGSAIGEHTGAVVA